MGEPQSRSPKRNFAVFFSFVRVANFPLAPGVILFLLMGGAGDVIGVPEGKRRRGARPPATPEAPEFGFLWLMRAKSPPRCDRERGSSHCTPCDCLTHARRWKDYASSSSAGLHALRRYAGSTRGRCSQSRDSHCCVRLQGQTLPVKMHSLSANTLCPGCCAHSGCSDIDNRSGWLLARTNGSSRLRS